MILDATTKSFEVVMGEAMTSANPSYVSAYVDVTTTTMTPISSDGTLNGVTPVTIVSAPAASTQRQIQSIYIHNVDTVSHTLIINYNDNATLRQVLTATLLVGETLVYEDKLGWRTYTRFGSLKAAGGGVVGSRFMFPIGLAVGTVSATVNVGSNASVFAYIGTASAASSSVDIQYRVTTALTANTWAEVAVYKASKFSLTPQNVNSASLGAGSNAQILTRLGFTDTSAVWTSLGLYTTNVTCSPAVAIGDELFIAWGSQDATPAQFRGGLADEPFCGNILFSASTRPSTTVQNRIQPISPTGVATVWCAAYLN